MKQYTLYKYLDFIAIFSMVFQTFVPLVYAVPPNNVYAQQDEQRIEQSTSLPSEQLDNKSDTKESEVTVEEDENNESEESTNDAKETTDNSQDKTSSSQENNNNHKTEVTVNDDSNTSNSDAQNDTDADLETSTNTDEAIDTNATDSSTEKDTDTEEKSTNANGDKSDDVLNDTDSGDDVKNENSQNAEDANDDAKQQLINNNTSKDLKQDEKGVADSSNDKTGNDSNNEKDKSQLQDKKEEDSESKNNIDGQNDDVAYGKWQKLSDTQYRIYVKEGEEYKFDFVEAKDDEVPTIKFTKIDTNENSENLRYIDVEIIRLTDEQQQVLGSLTDTAYDITSPMKDETFEYELTMPVGEIDDGDVTISYVKNKDDLQDVEKLKNDDVIKDVSDDEDVDINVDSGEKTIKATNIDHFSVWFTTSATILHEIKGRKIEYRNGNGIADWPITLCRFVDDNISKDCELVDSTNTSDDGTYSFTEIPNGVYKVSEDTDYNASDYTPMGATSYIVYLTNDGEYYLPVGNLVTNGGFENPVVDSGWNIFANGTDELGWEVTWFDGSTEYNGYTRPETALLELQKNVNEWSAKEGKQYAELDTDWGYTNGEPANVRIYQVLTSLCAGVTYKLSYDWSPRPGIEDNHIKVSLFGGNLNNTYEAEHSESGIGLDQPMWHHETFTFDVVPTSEPTFVSLQFTEIGNPDSFGMFLDNVSIVPVSDEKMCKLDTIDFYNRVNTSDENVVTLPAPIQTGYNEDNGDGDDGSTPHYPDENEIACLEGSKHINHISVHWRMPDDVDYDNLKFLRQYTSPNNTNWHGEEIYTNEYTNFRTFGGNPGTPGFYKSRVMAWVDDNNNNKVDDNELRSEWSNTCEIEYLGGICGDGNLDLNEECDGEAGVKDGYFCTDTCKLIPIYELGDNMCPEGTKPILFDQLNLDSNLGNVQEYSFEPNQTYILEASGTYSFGGNGTRMADAAYAYSNEYDNSRLGTYGTYRGVTSVIGDLGNGFGIIEWGDYNEDHLYNGSLRFPTNTLGKFVISDWYDEWYDNSCNNQGCLSDNEGSIDLNIYKCIEEIQPEEPYCDDKKMFVKINTEYEGDIWYGNKIAPKNEWFVLEPGAETSDRNEGVVLTYNGGDLTIGLLKKEDNSYQEFKGVIEFYKGEVTALTEGTGFDKLENEDNCGPQCHLDKFELTDPNLPTKVNVDFAIDVANDKGTISVRHVGCSELEACANDFSVNNSGAISIIDLTTGTETLVDTLMFGSSAAASHPTTGDVYYIERYGQNKRLAYYDISSRTNYLVGNTGINKIIDKLTFDQAGRLYAMSSDSVLYKINVSTGASTKLGKVKKIKKPGGDLTFNNRGRLFAHVKGGGLYRINLNTLNAVKVKDTDIQSTGMVYKDDRKFYATDNNYSLFSFKLSSSVNMITDSTRSINDLASCPVDLLPVKITGYKFNDYNANGIKDRGEPYISGVTIYLKDKNGNIIDQTVTDAHGKYSFNNVLGNRTYIITEDIDETQWYQTTPGQENNFQCKIKKAKPGVIYDDCIFGNFPLGSISGFKYEDVNNDGKYESDIDHMLPNWEITLTSEDGELYKETKTDADGYYTFDQLKPGKYIVCEKQQDNYIQTEPTTECYEVSIPNILPNMGVREPSYPFGNHHAVKDITVCKYDTRENPLSDWEIHLLGEQIESFELPTNTSDVTESSSLEEGNYVLVAKGLYEYRGNSGLLVDPTFSQRTNYDDPSYLDEPYFPWVNVMKLHTEGALGIMVNGEPTNWSDYLASYSENNADEHVYYKGYPNYSGTFTFSIYDNYYNDNVGTLNVDIYNGYSDRTDESGCVTFEDVPYGTYMLGEENRAGFEYVDGDRGEVAINYDSPSEYVLINRDIRPAKILAAKIICDDEKYLPNWGANRGGVPIDENTIDEFLSDPVNSEHCYKTTDWNFEWGYKGTVSSPGDDYVGIAGGNWHLFDKVNENGYKEADVNVDETINQVWVREVLQDEYIPFSYGLNDNTNINDYSAEFYCHLDGANYDNLEWIGSVRETDPIMNNKTYYCVAFNVEKKSIIKGEKFYDSNANGIHDEDEGTLPEWGIRIISTDPEFNYEKEIFTNENGNYEIEVPSDHTYKIEEVLQDGYYQTAPNFDGETEGIYDGYCEFENVEDQGVYECNFGNVLLGKIKGYKFNDQNGNGIWEENEPALGGFEIFIDSNGNGELDDDETSIVTSDGTELPLGYYEFTDLIPGGYYVCEVQQPENGWTQTYPISEELNNCHFVSIPQEDEGIDYNFGNYAKEPQLTIQESVNIKSMNISNLVPVTFTMKLKVENDPDYNVLAKNVTITHLLPEGFTYIPGSFTVSSSTGRDMSKVKEAVYHSPGTWDFSDVGNLVEGEEITLTLKAQANSTIVEPGVLKDVTWAKATPIDDDSDVILANADKNVGYVADNFVGEDVEITKEPESPESDAEVKDVEQTVTTEESGQVLGASTSALPATGSSTSILILSLIALILGGASLLFATKGSENLAILGKKEKNTKRRSRKGAKVAILVISFFTIMAITITETVNADVSYAASDFPIMVRVEQPKTPTNKPFKLTFVAIDTANRQVKVTCFVKKPNGTETTFDTIKTLKAGGNTDSCDANTSVLDQNGKYEFWVKAVAEANSVANESTLTSEKVLVEYNTEKPDKPKDFSVEKKNNCEYKVKFKTANDNRTAYVEVYRSDDKKFSVNEKSRVKTINIGSNEKYEYTDTLAGTQCGSTQYYAIRAFDKAGNPSDVVAQENVIIVEETTNTSEGSENVQETGAIVVSGTSTVAQEGFTGEIEVVPGTGGQVLGEATEEESAEPSGTTEEVQPESEEKNNGTNEKESKSFFQKIFSLTGLGILGVIALLVIILVVVL